MRKNSFKTNETERTYNEGWNEGSETRKENGTETSSETVKEKCGIGAAMVAATSVCVGLAAIGGARLYTKFKNMKSKRYDVFEEDQEDFDEAEYFETSDAPLDDSASNTFCEEHKKAMKQLEKDPRFSGEEFEKKVSSLQDELRKLASELRIREDESRKRCNRKNLIAFAQGVNEILEENDNGLTEDDKAELRNIMDQINDKIQPSSYPEISELFAPFYEDGGYKSDITSDSELPNASENEGGDQGNDLYEVFDNHYNVVAETYQKLRESDSLDTETRSKYFQIIDDNASKILGIVKGNEEMFMAYKERIDIIVKIEYDVCNMRLDDIDKLLKEAEKEPKNIVEETDDESISESAATSEEKQVDPKSIEKVNQKFSSGEDKQKGGKRKKSKGQRR